MLRPLILAAVVAAALSVPAAAADDDAKKSAPFANFVLSEPAVPVAGPFATVLRKAAVGDLVVLQITYPIAPPFPKLAKVTIDNASLTEVGVFKGAGELAVLTPKESRGRIGVGYLTVVLKAAAAGKSNVLVAVTMADGGTREVPFSFQVTPAVQ